MLNDAAHSASYVIQIEQGDLFRLGKLEVAGLDDTHARAIAQPSRIRPGDPYDSTYWNRFAQEAIPKLPGSPWGRRLFPAQTIHRDTKTVGVRLTFHTGGAP